MRHHGAKHMTIRNHMHGYVTTGAKCFSYGVCRRFALCRHVLSKCFLNRVLRASAGLLADIATTQLGLWRRAWRWLRSLSRKFADTRCLRSQQQIQLEQEESVSARTISSVHSSELSLHIVKVEAVPINSFSQSYGWPSCDSCVADQLPAGVRHSFTDEVESKKDTRCCTELLGSYGELQRSFAKHTCRAAIFVFSPSVQSI